MDVLKELMAANRLRQKDLLDVFKHKAPISEILSRKRPFSVEHIRTLAKLFQVSAEVFVRKEKSPFPQRWETGKLNLKISLAIFSADARTVGTPSACGHN